MRPVSKGRYVDRTGWEPGPWDDEDDLYYLSVHDVPCVIGRTPMGNLNGYVAVPRSHRWWGKYPDDIEELADFNLTFAGYRHEAMYADLPSFGDAWWFGFDHLHLLDLAPGMPSMGDALGARLGMQPTYKTVHYVLVEVTRLAEVVASA